MCLLRILMWDSRIQFITFTFLLAENFQEKEFNITQSEEKNVYNTEKSSGTIGKCGVEHCVFKTYSEKETITTTTTTTTTMAKCRDRSLLLVKNYNFFLSRGKRECVKKKPVAHT